MAAKANILVVDDVESNVDVLMEILSDEYDVTVAMDGLTAIDVAMQERPDLVLLDVRMPGVDGHEVCRLLKRNEWMADIPVIFVTSMGEAEDEEKGFALGAVDYLVKPVNPAVTRARVKTHLELKATRNALKDQNTFLESKVIERTRELQVTQDVTIESLSSLAEFRDNDTGMHTRRTGRYVHHLAVQLRSLGLHTETLTEAYIGQLAKSAPLHDIGKVGVPDAILLKPGKLTDEEWVEMRRHPEYGYEAIARAEDSAGTTAFLLIAKEITYSHHEKWDGSGYPRGLAEIQIPLSGRLMAIADVYDALISRRPYKPAFSHAKAVRIISESTGQFDPDVMTAFSRCEQQFLATALELADDDEQRRLLVE